MLSGPIRSATTVTAPVAFCTTPRTTSADADCANSNKCLLAKCDSGACKVTLASSGAPCDDGDARVNPDAVRE